jgi:hypothetical protein
MTGGSDRLGWAALTALVVGGTWLRLARLDTIPLHFDALHPIYEALRIAQGVELPWRGTGSGFRFGVLQAWLTVPLVMLGTSLRQVLGLNALLHGLGALPLGLSGRAIGGWSCGLIAAALYGAWPILVAHPHHGGYTYQAPILVALAAWLATRALTGERPRAVIGLSITLAAAVHMHPYALAPALGALALWPSLVRRYRWRTVGAGTFAGLAVLAPMILDNALLFRDRFAHEAGVSLVQDAAMAARNPFDVLWDAAQQGGAGWPREAVLAVLLIPVVALLTVGVVRARSPAGPMALWTACSALTWIGLGAGLGYAQPYHLAVVLPLGFCLVGWLIGEPLHQIGLRLPRLGRGLALAAGLAVLAGAAAALSRTLETVYLRPALSQRHLGMVETVTDALIADAAGRPRTLALVAESSVVTVGDNVAWHMEQWFRGEPNERFPSQPGFNLDWPRAYVVAELRPETWAHWPTSGTVLLERTTRGDTLLKLVVFEDLTVAAGWMRQLCELRNSGLDIRVAPPREALGGVPGTDGPHVSLERWAESCPHKTDDKWL